MTVSAIVLMVVRRRHFVPSSARKEVNKNPHAGRRSRRGHWQIKNFFPASAPIVKCMLGTSSNWDPLSLKKNFVSVCGTGFSSICSKKMELKHAQFVISIILRWHRHIEIYKTTFSLCKCGSRDYLKPPTVDFHRKFHWYYWFQ